jgi:hypothetical protein
MKLLELYKLWDRYNIVMADPTFDATVKQTLCGEIIRSLPPVMLCTSFESSRKLLEEAMRGRLGELERDGRTQRKEGPEEVPTEPKHGKKRAREKSI